MCGRIIQSGGPEFPGLEILLGTPDDSRTRKLRYNGAPSQDLLVIRRNPETGDDHAGYVRWGLIPHWVSEANPRTKPINATAERVASAVMFRAAYARRRCIVPVDGFFEWRSDQGQKTRQPYVIGMKDGSRFALAGLWENWRNPRTAEWQRTFCIITCPANKLIVGIHDRMPVILPPEAYERWLACIERDPRDLLVPYPAEPMHMWPVSPRVNSPANDDPDVLTPLHPGSQ